MQSPILRVTQKELARRLRLNQATVSRALAKSPLISEEVRERVHREAAALGYRPDPVLASLNAYRRTQRPILSGSSLMWMSFETFDYERRMYTAARQCAEQFGFYMDEMFLDPKLSHKDVRRILVSRGVAGLIFAPQIPSRVHLRLNLDGFAIVAIGRTLYRPALDITCPDHFSSMTVCYRHLYQLGYRRIGLAIPHRYSERVEGIWTGAYLYEQAEKRITRTIPAFQQGLTDPKVFIDWIKKYRIDCLLMAREKDGMEAIDTLKKEGLSVPRDMGMALLATPWERRRNVPDFTGIQEPREELAQLAVKMLVSRIRNNELGVPALRQISMLPGEWKPGSTAGRLPGSSV